MPRRGGNIPINIGACAMAMARYNTSGQSRRSAGKSTSHIRARKIAYEGPQLLSPSASTCGMTTARTSSSIWRVRSKTGRRTATDAMYKVGRAREVILEAAEIAAFRLDEPERDLLRLAVEATHWEDKP